MRVILIGGRKPDDRCDRIKDKYNVLKNELSTG